MGLLHYLLPRSALPPRQPCLFPPPPHQGVGAPTLPAGKLPRGAQHPTLCSDMFGGTQAQQHPWGVRGWGAGGGALLSQAGPPG